MARKKIKNMPTYGRQINININNFKDGIMNYKSTFLVLPLILLISFLFSHTSAANQGSIVEQIFSSDSVNRLTKQENLFMTSINNDDSLKTIIINPDIHYQTFEGFGESFEGSTVYNLSRMSPEKRNEVLKLLIDPDSGAGFNMFRICIGTSDFSPQSWGWYSLDDSPDGKPDTNLEHFSIQKDSANKIISVLTDAINIAKGKNVNLKFIASPWSPPAWMKTNDSMCGGELKPEYNQVYARYLYKFLKAYKEQGIPIYAITIQNEPGWLPTYYPGAYMPPDQQSVIIKELKRLIDNNPPITTKILAWDWNFSNEKKGCDSSISEIDLATSVADKIQKDSIDISFHSYDWDGNAKDIRNVSELHCLYPNLKIFHTEQAFWNTDGMDKIVKLFRNWMSSYVGWVTMLDTADTTDHHGHATPPYLIYNSKNPVKYDILPTFYLKQQFSKYIQLNAKRIYSCDFANDSLSNVAFLNPDTTIVVIIINQSLGSQKFRVETESNQFIATIPGKTVATYKWKSRTCMSTLENIAKGKNVMVSSTEFGNATYTVDGNSNTRWGSDGNDNQWIYVDLGCKMKISQVNLDWEDAFGKNYMVQFSNDANNWDSLIHERNGSKGIHGYCVSGEYRYAKMQGIKRGNDVWGYSLYEFEVYPADTSCSIRNERDDHSISNSFFFSPKYTYSSNRGITFRFGAQIKSTITLQITNLLGKVIATPIRRNTFQPGIVNYNWIARNDNGAPLSKGLYLVHFFIEPENHLAPSFFQTRKIIIK